MICSTDFNGVLVGEFGDSPLDVLLADPATDVGFQPVTLRWAERHNQRGSAQRTSAPPDAGPGHRASPEFSLARTFQIA
jgi:hypothetical protein